MLESVCFVVENATKTRFGACFEYMKSVERAPNYSIILKADSSTNQQKKHWNADFYFTQIKMFFLYSNKKLYSLIEYY